MLLEEWIGEDVERADAPVAVVVAGAQTLRTSLAEQALEISEAGVVRLRKVPLVSFLFVLLLEPGDLEDSKSRPYNIHVH